MGLSGDVCELSESQWSILRSGIAFYKDSSDIICSGKTIGIHQTSVSYNNPTGEQLVIRVLPSVSADTSSRGALALRALVVYHRFESSLPLGEFVSALSKSGELSDLEKSVLSAIAELSANAELGEISEGSSATVSSFGEADGDFTAQAFIVSASCAKSMLI